MSTAAPLQTATVEPLPTAGATLLAQRKCACDAGASGLIGECEDCSKKKLGLQAKLRVNEPGDAYEQEADRVAAQVLARPTHSEVSSAAPRIQRYTRSSSAVPASVDQVLAGSGRPLDPTLRQDMEQRFGHDFSRVRVHTSTAAEQSARDVNANAYTAGHNIVFSTGRFVPATHEGRRLIAHELTHVVQQRAGVPASVQRAPAGREPSIEPKVVDVDMKSNDPNCQYQEGEAARSLTPQGILNYDVEKAEFLGIEPADAVVIADFTVDDPELRPSTEADLRKYWIPTFDTRSTSSLDIVGFTDCVGWEHHNKSLRQQRASAVARLLPGAPTRSAPYDEHLVANTSERGRALNRSVIIKRRSHAPRPVSPKREMTIAREQPDTKQCSEEQRWQLSVAFPAAKLMAERARGAVSSKDKGPVITFLLQRYFGDDALSHLPDIRAGFSKILTDWKGWDPRFDCEEQTAEKCQSDFYDHIPSGFRIGAYVTKKRRLFSPNSAYGAVHVCSAAFAHPATQQGLWRLSAIILHELSHRLDNTNDKKYCLQKDAWCSSLRTQAAIDNADSYAQFAREILNSSL